VEEEFGYDNPYGSKNYMTANVTDPFFLQTVETYSKYMKDVLINIKNLGIRNR